MCFWKVVFVGLGCGVFGRWSLVCCEEVDWRELCGCCGVVGYGVVCFEF